MGGQPAWLVIAGVIFKLTGLAEVGLAFFAAAVLFTFVTLPVEFGAWQADVERAGIVGVFPYFDFILLLIGCKLFCKQSFR